RMHKIVKSGPLALGAALGALALAMPGAAPAQDAAAGASAKLTTTLNGAAEVPGPGDDNGAGLFEGRIDPSEGEICYTLTVSNIEPATAAHIHSGGPGDSGPPVVTLETPDDAPDDTDEECQDIDRGLAQAIAAEPAKYYVNVHNASFPAGAIRGQLGK